MFSNMLKYLEQTVIRTPDRTAFYDDREKLTFAELMETAQRIGTALAAHTHVRTPVALLMDPRSIRTIPAIFGTMYAGCAYAPLDIAMPPERLNQLLTLLEPSAIIADEKGMKAIQELDVKQQVVRYEAAANEQIDAKLLYEIRRQSSVYDPMSILYTSGSTGIPKGSIQTHFSYMHWTEATIEKYGFDSGVVFGNQSPFFYANSIIDIFPPVALGATVYLLPAGVLSFPRKLVECLKEHHVTELTMTPSSFIVAVNAGVLEPGCLPELRYGIMSGESMPWTPLETWMKATPNAMWWHFYGSTEMFSVAVGKVLGPPKEGERLSVGEPYAMTHILFVDEEGNEVPPGTPGEMLLSSPWVSVAYHRDAARTQTAWVTDPLGKGWHERFYRAGDIGYLRQDGQLVVLGRRDTQIKHMGYRMELGELEVALSSIPGWEDGCVLFDSDTGKIWCFYCGALLEKTICQELRTKLARYMLPDVFVHLQELPHTATMKLDRGALKAMMKGQ